MNAENSADLFLTGRMGTISEGVAALLEGRKPPRPPSSIASFLVYALLFGVVVLQLVGMTRSAACLRRGGVRGGRVGTRLRIALSLALSLAWGALVLVLVPKQLGLPLLVAAQGLPDLAYVLVASAVIAVGWGLVRATWASASLRKAGRHVADEAAAIRPVATPS